MMPAIVITILGPYRSLRYPVPIARIPFTRLAIEAAPASVALDQPNSFSNAGMKMPKETSEPMPSICSQKAAAVTT